MTDPAIIAERLAASYMPVPVDAVASSGHSFLIRNRNQEPPARAMQEKRIARTLRSLADHALVPVEPRVWKTQDRDLLIRLDGFGPTVDMDADAARLALIDVLGSPEPDEGQHAVIVDGLHGIASTMTATTMRIGCSAPTPWRPACFECDPSLIPAFGWWTGSNGLAQRPTRPTVEHTVLDPDTAALLPRVVCIGDGPVTLDDRFGMLLRPVSWTGRTHQTMDAMGVIRAHAALADMLARHPLRDAEETR
jgi:hypothetical protein